MKKAISRATAPFFKIRPEAGFPAADFSAGALNPAAGDGAATISFC
jgi:hypothetical protein